MRVGNIPVASPTPPRLSEAISALRALEESGIFSNFGPVNTRFEASLTHDVFAGIGQCLTVCNATTGLMLAMREAIQRRPDSRRRYALMPSFTFAAAAQAALWNNLTPLFCDIDPVTWSADPACELRLLDEFRDQIAVIVPYATFGYDIDLAWYEALQREYDIPVVVDAAASLGTISADGRGFGTGFSGTVIYSMHATKSFSTGEGGVIYSADAERIRTLRTMSSFGFGEPRNATMLGLNGKLSEVAALLACLKLEGIEDVMQRRSDLVTLYRELLPALCFQPGREHRQAHQFTSALLPTHMAPHRAFIQAELSDSGVNSATYFSPHVAEQVYFRQESSLANLPVTNDIASRMLTLPLFDTMTEDEVKHVCAALNDVLARTEKKHAMSKRRRDNYGCVGVLTTNMVPASLTTSSATL